MPLVLSADEVARLIDAAPNPRYKTIVMTLYSTGMRRAELCIMRPEDVDKERMVIRIPHGKGDKAREVSLSPTLLDPLRQLPISETPQRLDVPEPKRQTAR